MIWINNNLYESIEAAEIRPHVYLGYVYDDIPGTTWTGAICFYDGEEEKIREIQFQVADTSDKEWTKHAVVEFIQFIQGHGFTFI